MIRYKIQIVSCASAKIPVTNGNSAQVKKYLKISEMGGIQGSRTRTAPDS